MKCAVTPKMCCMITFPLLKCHKQFTFSRFADSFNESHMQLGPMFCLLGRNRYSVAINKLHKVNSHGAKVNLVRSIYLANCENSF